MATYLKDMKIANYLLLKSNKIGIECRVDKNENQL